VVVVALALAVLLPGTDPVADEPSPPAAGIDASAAASAPAPSVPAEPVAPPAAAPAPAAAPTTSLRSAFAVSLSGGGGPRGGAGAIELAYQLRGGPLVLGIMGGPRVGAGEHFGVAIGLTVGASAALRPGAPRLELLVDAGVEYYTEDEDEFYVVTSRNTSGSGATLGFGQARAGVALPQPGGSLLTLGLFLRATEAADVTYTTQECVLIFICQEETRSARYGGRTAGVFVAWTGFGRRAAPAR
jgi:hypothetical protein